MLSKPIYSKLLALYENYEADTTIRETVTRAEQREEEAFISQVLQSEVMKETLRYWV